MDPIKPRRRCQHCEGLYDDHYERQCLFAPTFFKEMTAKQYAAYNQRSRKPMFGYFQQFAGTDDSGLLVTSSAFKPKKRTP